MEHQKNKVITYWCLSQLLLIPQIVNSIDVNENIITLQETYIYVCKSSIRKLNNKTWLGKQLIHITNLTSSLAWYLLYIILTFFSQISI